MDSMCIHHGVPGCYGVNVSSIYKRQSGILVTLGYSSVTAKETSVLSYGDSACQIVGRGSFGLSQDQTRDRAFRIQEELRVGA